MKRSRLAWHAAWGSVLSFPGTLTALLMFAVRSTHARSVLRWVRTVWLGDAHLVEHPSATWWLKALLLSAASLAITAYLTLGILLNLAYPLRPDVKVTDWGGPTLLGRWGVHAAGGILFALLALWLLPALPSRARRWLTMPHASPVAG